MIEVIWKDQDLLAITFSTEIRWKLFDFTHLDSWKADSNQCNNNKSVPHMQLLEFNLERCKPFGGDTEAISAGRMQMPPFQDMVLFKMEIAQT